VKLTWPAVVVVGLVLAAITTLGALGRDTTALIGLGTLLLAGLGLIVGQQQAIKEQGNGNTSKLLAMVENQSHLLARMLPPGAATIDGEVVEPAEEHPPVVDHGV
jgi:hypothetical protein